jgi:hypothetical protein
MDVVVMDNGVWIAIGIGIFAICFGVPVFIFYKRRNKGKKVHRRE